jgi:hypothetical protein
MLPGAETVRAIRLFSRAKTFENNSNAGAGRDANTCGDRCG